MLPEPRPEPLVARVMRAHKERILAQEAAVMREMARRWLDIERSLEAAFLALASEVEQLQASGGAVSLEQVLQLERSQRLMYQARAQMAEFVDWAVDDLEDYQAKLIAQGIEDGMVAIRAVYMGAGKVGAYFDVLDVRALEMLIGLAGDGSPLRRYLEGTYGQGAANIINALMEGTAKGWNPVKTARYMAERFGMGLQPALNTARTEGLRVYRAASLEQYRESGVVRGYKRMAAHDERVCAGCLFTDGMLIESLDYFEEHPQGRCTAVPVVRGLEAPEWTEGAAWFEAQEERVQRTILGPERYRAWQEGRMGLDEMVQHVDDPTWGGSFVPAAVG